MKILLTGKRGQVGHELHRSLQPLGEVVAVHSGQLDLANPDQIRDVIRQVRPQLIVNPAAYTAVDMAETETDLAMKINGTAPRILAEECVRIGAALIHYSTDYVFDGTKEGAYTEEDALCPANVYGKTKAEGERAIQAVGGDYLILRTSWVYGMHGKNFLKTILRLAQEKEVLRIVSDQHGAPTWSRTIADTTANILTQLYDKNSQKMDFESSSGIYHLASQGFTTWYEFAQTILNNLVDKSKTKVLPISTSEYPLPAKRPRNSRLSSERLIGKFCHLPEWEKALLLCQENS